ncbi:MAG: TraB/GumN family protein [Hyphomicrobiaceae bacterium]
MRRLLLLASVLLAVFVCVPIARAAAPVCGGRDLAAEMRSDAAAWARISASAAGIPNGEALLWRVTTAKGAVSHLFGTVHISDARVNALSPPTEKALGEARVVALEIADMSPANIGKAMAGLRSMLVYRNGASLRNVLSAEEQVQAARAIEKIGMPAETLGVLRPWVVMMSLALSDCERARTASGLASLDTRIEKRARAQGLRVTGLETVRDQISAMAAAPDGDQVTMLRASLKLHARSDDVLETLVQRYLQRKLHLVMPIQEELWRQVDFPIAAFASFQEAVISKRNVRMRDAALPLIAEGGAFIAVGALHLPGRDGLVALLRKAGHTVEAVD